MIDEGRIAALRASYATGVPVSHDDYLDLLETMDRLWAVARQAKRWVVAAPGPDSVHAEDRLVKTLEALSAP